MASTTTTSNAGTGVVAAVTAHLARIGAQGFASRYGNAVTPAQLGTACGYAGSKASALRRHIGRQHNQGAVATGHGRYSAYTYNQWLVLMQLGHLVAKASTTATQRQAASKRVARTLWQQRSAKAQASGAKRSRKGKAAPATPAPDAPAQDA